MTAYGVTRRFSRAQTANSTAEKRRIGPELRESLNREKPQKPEKLERKKPENLGRKFLGKNLDGEKFVKLFLGEILSPRYT